MLNAKPSSAYAGHGCIRLLELFSTRCEQHHKNGHAGEQAPDGLCMYSSFCLVFGKLSGCTRQIFLKLMNFVGATVELNGLINSPSRVHA
jgi:hypothetical protein